MDNKIDKQINLLFWNLHESGSSIRRWYASTPSVYVLQDIIGSMGIRIGLTDLYESEADCD